MVYMVSLSKMFVNTLNGFNKGETETSTFTKLFETNEKTEPPEYFCIESSECLHSHFYHRFSG